MAADPLKVKLRLNVMPVWLLKPLGLFQPLMRELPEMRFTWDTPYRVDASKFTKSVLDRPDTVRNRNRRHGAFVRRNGAWRLVRSLEGQARRSRD